MNPNPKPASAGQLKYLESLTGPDRLAALSAAEARFLIAFLLGPPPNASRAQQLFLLGLLERLSRERIGKLIRWLAERTKDEGTGEAGQGAKPSPPPASTHPVTPGRQRTLPADPPSSREDLPPGVSMDEVF